MPQTFSRAGRPLLWLAAAVVIALAVGASLDAAPQDSRSAGPAKELSDTLDRLKLDLPGGRETRT